MNTNIQHTIPSANVQVHREEVRQQAGQAPHILYYLGWGDDGKLVGDPMPFEELKALHALIGRVIERNNANN